MDRWACINIPALPLQVLLVRRPDWIRLPVAVVTRDAPTGEATWVNGWAKKHGVRPGLRYSAALGIVPTLRAGVIGINDIEKEVNGITRRLGSLTPDVEPSHDMPGVFWLNASGMTRLFPNEYLWARAVRMNVRTMGYHAGVVVGFTKWGTYAVARSGGGIVVFPDSSTERKTAYCVSLAVLDLPTEVRDTLDLLGVTTLGAFLALPAKGILRRFGEEAYALHRRVSGDLWEPLSAEPRESSPEKQVILDYPEKDSERLLALVECHLAPLLNTLERRGEALEELRIALFLDNGDCPLHVLRPASPTLSLRHLIDLVRLRLETQTLSGAVTELRITVIGASAQADQAELLAGASQRDLVAGARALAHLRARFGEKAVVRAVLQESYLPAEAFRWEEVDSLQLPSPTPSDRRSLVRRIYTDPTPLTDALRARLVRSCGSYLLSGWWWNAHPHEDEFPDEEGAHCVREYRFVETDDERLLWVYYDRELAAWFVQGEVR